MSAAPLKRVSQLSSHSSISISRWLVGSSSNNRCGSSSNTRASMRRVFCPPPRWVIGVSRGSSERPRGARMLESGKWGDSCVRAESYFAWSCESFGLEDKAEARDTISVSSSASETKCRPRAVWSVWSGWKSIPWARYPTRRFGRVEETVPESGCSMPARMRMRVVLPQPLGPMRPTRSLLLILKEMS